ncbi:hypothetical protein ACQY0O_005532 [Thecaphora frezii]
MPSLAPELDTELLTLASLSHASDLRALRTKAEEFMDRVCFRPWDVTKRMRSAHNRQAEIQQRLHHLLKEAQKRQDRASVDEVGTYLVKMADGFVSERSLAASLATLLHQHVVLPEREMVMLQKHYAEQSDDLGDILTAEMRRNERGNYAQTYGAELQPDVVIKVRYALAVAKDLHYRYKEEATSKGAGDL